MLLQLIWRTLVIFVAVYFDTQNKYDILFSLLFGVCSGLTTVIVTLVKNVRLLVGLSVRALTAHSIPIEENYVNFVIRPFKYH